LPEVWLELRDKSGGQVRIHRVQVIGVLSDITTASMTSAYVNSQAIAGLTGEAVKPASRKLNSSCAACASSWEPASSASPPMVAIKSLPPPPPELS
jgi:hypothetical protein